MNKRRYYATKQKYVALNQLSWNVTYIENGKEHSTIISVYSDENIETKFRNNHPNATLLSKELRQSGE